MDKEQEQHNIQMMLKLLETNSPTARLNALLLFLRAVPNFYSKEAEDALIEAFTTSVSTKAEAGRTEATKRWNDKKKNLQKGERYVFVKSNTFQQLCKGCSEFIVIFEPMFAHYDKDNKGDGGYHITCTPDEDKLKSKKYQQYKEYTK
jgi:hypothetical protein